ncbi:TonB-dependent receptor [Candidatus Accumulibacter phosphatis]|uniref:TonB-dependent receptor n=1 Tax=Candidatus Accumulibacter phosphatis TaxID=327160 RepID=A0ABX1TY29_9PROT|nr:TonB-dependent receptor [Candidatus Accumulibacter phosphatis]
MGRHFARRLSTNCIFPPSAFFSGGNPDLQPEQAKNTEVGANWERGNHRASLVLYNNVVTDLIEFRPPTYAPVNVSKALLRGATLTYDGRFSEWGGGRCRRFPRSEKRGRRAEQGQSTGPPLHTTDEQLHQPNAWQLGFARRVATGRQSLRRPGQHQSSRWLRSGQPVCRLSPAT